MAAADGSAAAVEAHELVKRYEAPDGRPFNAVDGVSFAVRPGEVFGLLGPNGAGKTTTLEMLEGLRQPTTGRAAVLGLDVQRDQAAVKQRIGIQLQAGAYFDHLTLEEILDLFGSFYRRRVPPAELLRRVDLVVKRRSLVKHLSGGQAQRFSIIAALVNDPEVVFLDEPTTGLDPQARRNLWDVIRDINAGGKTVILTTHYMEEADRLCERLAIVDHGCILNLDTPGSLKRSLPGGHILDLWARSSAPLLPLLELVPGVVRTETVASDSEDGVARLRLFVDARDGLLDRVLHGVREAGGEVRHVSLTQPSLEDVYIHLTGKELRE